VSGLLASCLLRTARTLQALQPTLAHSRPRWTGPAAHAHPLAWTGWTAGEGVG